MGMQWISSQISIWFGILYVAMIAAMSQQHDGYSKYIDSKIVLFEVM